MWKRLQFAETHPEPRGESECFNVTVMRKLEEFHAHLTDVCVHLGENADVQSLDLIRDKLHVE